MLEVAEYVFVVTEEAGKRVKFKGTYNSYAEALTEYSKRIKGAPTENVISLQKVEKYFQNLDNPTKW
jgi:hypothetical protein